MLTIEKRIDTYGVTEPIIQKLGEDRILVQLPGFTDIDAAKKLVEQTGFLEFREVELNEAGKPVYLSDYLERLKTGFFNKKETGSRIFVNEEARQGLGKPIAFLVKDENGLKFTDVNGNPIDKETLKQGPTQVPSWIPARGDDGTPLTGAYLSDAAPTLQQGVTGCPGRGQHQMERGRGRNLRPDCQAPVQPQETYSLEHALGIFLDNALISAPQIRAQAFHGSGVISGSFTVDEATRAG